MLLQHSHTRFSTVLVSRLFKSSSKYLGHSSLSLSQHNSMSVVFFLLSAQRLKIPPATSRSTFKSRSSKSSRGCRRFSCKLNNGDTDAHVTGLLSMHLLFILNQLTNDMVVLTSETLETMPSNLYFSM